MVPGADVWLESETAEALILMGAWCGAYLADTTRKKTGMRLRPQVGSGVCQTERNRKKWSKVAQGGVLPLDRYYEGPGGCLSGTIIVSHTLEEEMDHGAPYDPPGSDSGTRLHEGVIRGVGTQ